LWLGWRRRHTCRRLKDGMSDDRARNSGKGAFGANWPGSEIDNRRHANPATVPDLFEALQRIEAEALTLAEKAAEAIQHHSFDPYREFCEKRAEHAALMSVLRNHIGPNPNNSKWPVAADKHDRALVTVSIQACLKFSFALSATPNMPMGARETFIHELEMLRTTREQLLPMKDQEGIGNLIDELETALMILEEIVDRAPALEEF
jgi:hypothetical protein